MPYVNEEQIKRAKEIDAFSYIHTYEPNNLMKEGTNEYKLKDHPSFCLRSDGVWHWKSHDIKGRSALDYLVKVQGMDFISAVQLLLDDKAIISNTHGKVMLNKKHRPFILPDKSDNITQITEYLTCRGIDSDVLDFCISRDILYQETVGHKGYEYHNCVFVGRDETGQERYAMKRGCFTGFCGEVSGSNKEYPFHLMEPIASPCVAVALSECPIDTLSYATIQKAKYGQVWRHTAYVSMGGSSLLGIERFLRQNNHITHLVAAVDNDETGYRYVGKIIDQFKPQGYQIVVDLPEHKDWNKSLMISKGLDPSSIQGRNRSSKRMER